MALKLYVSSASPYVSDVRMQVLDSISIASILKYTSGSDNSLKRNTREKGLDLSRNKREESLWLDGHPWLVHDSTKGTMCCYVGIKYPKTANLLRQYAT